MREGQFGLFINEELGMRNEELDLAEARRRRGWRAITKLRAAIMLYPIISNEKNHEG